MKQKEIVGLFATLISTCVIAQETFNFEGALVYGSLKADDNTTQTTTLVAGKYYFKPVVINNSQPFMELDFLQKAGGISFRTGSVKYEDDTFVQTTLKPMEIAGTVYVDKFVIGISNSSSDSDFKLKSNNARYYGIKTTETAFTIGYFVTDNTVVSFDNASDKYTYTRSTNALTDFGDLKKTSNGLSSHTVMSLGGSQSLVVDLSYAEIKRDQTTSQTNTEYGAKLRYYPASKYYFQAGYVNNTGDYARDKGNTMLFGAGVQITPRLGLMLSGAKFSVSDSAQNTGYSSTTLTAGYRF
jgi:hypothetical protein